MALLSQFYHNGLFPIKKGPTPKSRKSLSTKYAEGEMEALQVALRGKAWKWTAHAERSLMPLELSRACAHCALNAILHCLCNPLRINTIYWQSIGYTRCIFADVSKCFCYAVSMQVRGGFRCGRGAVLKPVHKVPKRFQGGFEMVCKRCSKRFRRGSERLQNCFRAGSSYCRGGSMRFREMVSKRCLGGVETVPDAVSERFRGRPDAAAKRCQSGFRINAKLFRSDFEAASMRHQGCFEALPNRFGFNFVMVLKRTGAVVKWL